LRRLDVLNGEDGVGKLTKIEEAGQKPVEGEA